MRTPFTKHPKKITKIKEIILQNVRQDLRQQLSTLFLKYHIIPDKKLSQNFIISQEAIDRILSYVPRNKVVLEVGPGLGFITKQIDAKRLFAIELDKKLADIVRKTTNAIVIESDVLKFDLESFVKKEKIDVILSAVPYHISTDFVLKILPLPIKRAVLILQQNFVEKIAFGVYISNYLSVLVYYYTKPMFLDVFGPNIFYPVPKVNSQIMVLDYKKQRPFTKQQEYYFTNIVYVRYFIW